MPNPQRGEIEATLAGKPYTLCLTLGALAELEARLDSGSLIELLGRFQSGHLKASDLISLLAAGLKGGGNPISEAEIAAMPLEGGAERIIAIAAALLNATFANDDLRENKHEEGT